MMKFILHHHENQVPHIHHRRLNALEIEVKND